MKTNLHPSFLSTRLSTLSHCVVIAATALLPLTASAQWQWRDGSGGVVLSNTAPPSTVSSSQIMTRGDDDSASHEGHRHHHRHKVKCTPVDTGPVNNRIANPQSTTTIPCTPEPEDDCTPVDTGPVNNLVANSTAVTCTPKHHHEQNCKRAREGKRHFDEGRPVYKFNSRGERVAMDEGERREHSRHLQSAIHHHCTPTPTPPAPPVLN